MNFNGRYLFLTYKSHLKLEELKSILTDCAFDAVHETSDTDHKYDHTHVLICYNKKTHVRDARKWDIGEIHPHLKKVASREHWINLTSYICKQNEPFYRSLTGNEYLWLGGVRNIIQKHKSWRDVINDSSIEDQVKKYLAWAKECWNARTMPNLTKELKLRDWQNKCLNKLQTQNDRNVLWVYDKAGGKGKSTLTNYLIDNLGAFFCNSGNTRDVAYAYNHEDTVIFDLPKSTIDDEGKDWTPYRLMEMFKDGRLFSSKYHSGMKRFKSCKVVVFANYLPDRSKMSNDRWAIWDLNEKVVPNVLNIKGDIPSGKTGRNKRRRKNRKMANRSKTADIKSEPIRRKQATIPSSGDTSADSDEILSLERCPSQLDSTNLQALHGRHYPPVVSPVSRVEHVRPPADRISVLLQ